MDQKTTKMILVGIAVVLVILTVLKESKAKAALGAKKPRATLGAKSKSASKPKSGGCDNVAIDSPDFARCATLGAGRTVLAGNPTKQAHNINTEFVQDNFDTNAGNLGNPFAMKVDDSFVKDDFLGGSKVESTDTISRSGGQAFPFSQSGTISSGVQPKGSVTGGLVLGKMMDHTKGVKFQALADKPSTGKVPAPARSTARSSGSLGSGDEGVKFDTAFLGSAVSPVGSDVLGASKEEIAQSAQQLNDVNVVQRTNGGQLNLLIHS